EWTAAMGYSPAEVDLALLAVKALSPAGAATGAAEGAGRELRRASRLSRQAAAKLAVEAANLVLPHLRVLVVAGRLERARLEAVRLWRRLEACPPERRRLLVEGLAEFRGWALAERLTEE